MIGSMSLLLAGCSDVAADMGSWECKRHECTVRFALSNETAASQTVLYTLRAHRLEKVFPGATGTRRDIVVGVFQGEVELPASQRRQFTQTFKVSARPSRIAVTARPKNEQ
jgi:hypothetical protein